MAADLRKPFNPILGETLQGYFKDGSMIYMEHISHHPPISSYLIEGKNKEYRMYGSVEFKGSVKNSGNTLNIFFEGANYVEFEDGHKIEIHYPITKVQGLMWGAKTVNAEGYSIVIDKGIDGNADEEYDYNNKAVLIFNPKKASFESTIAPT